MALCIDEESSLADIFREMKAFYAYSSEKYLRQQLIQDLQQRAGDKAIGFYKSQLSQGTTTPIGLSNAEAVAEMNKSEPWQYPCSNMIHVFRK